MKTIREALKTGEQLLEEAGIQSSRVNAARLLLGVLGESHHLALLFDETPLSDTSYRQYRSLLVRRCKHEPLQYILRYQHFWESKLSVTPGVLIPRPETETLIRVVQELYPNTRFPLQFADFGAGSGCLLRTLLDTYPNAQGIGIDKNPIAIQLSRKNCQEARHDARFQLHLTTWNNWKPTKALDCILSNPPYVKNHQLYQLDPEVHRHEPKNALVGGTSGMESLRSIASKARTTLKKSGFLILEINESNHPACIAQYIKWNALHTYHDLSQRFRCIVFQK